MTIDYHVNPESNFCDAINHLETFFPFKIQTLHSKYQGCLIQLFWGFFQTDTVISNHSSTRRCQVDKHYSSVAQTTAKADLSDFGPFIYLFLLDVSVAGIGILHKSSITFLWGWYQTDPDTWYQYSAILRYLQSSMKAD